MRCRILASLGAAFLFAACASNGAHEPEGFVATAPDAGAGSSGGGADAAHGGDGNYGVFSESGASGCKGAGKSDTTISGTVFDPAGLRPLYDAIVYVPSAPLQPFPSGVSCDTCGALASGAPIAATLTGPDGKFVLKGVSPGTDVPLVLQIGKWRRKVTVPSVAACADTPMNDPTVMRLPRNQSEGDMPQMAIATGWADPFECLLRKVGIDDAEFTSDQGSGRVHLYAGGSEGAGPAPAAAGSSSATTLWSDLSRMKRYDLVVNACEGSLHPEEKPAASLKNFLDYVNAGGRTFSTHWEYYWISNGPTPLPETAQFITDQVGPDPIQGIVNTSFPKGAAFAQWLVNVGASVTAGQLVIQQPRYDAVSVNPPALEWIQGADAGSKQPALLHYTFDTPFGAPEAQQCGKVLYSDFHVEVTTSASPTGSVFPAECAAGVTMTANDLALEFMLFDLSACIQNDTQPPTPPTTQ